MRYSRDTLVNAMRRQAERGELIDFLQHVEGAPAKGYESDAPLVEAVDGSLMEVRSLVLHE